MELCTNIWGSSVSHYMDRLRPRGLASQRHSMKQTCTFPSHRFSLSRGTSKRPSSKSATVPPEGTHRAAWPLHREAAWNPKQGSGRGSLMPQHLIGRVSPGWARQSHAGSPQTDPGGKSSGPRALECQQTLTQVATISRTWLVLGRGTWTSKQMCLSS